MIKRRRAYLDGSPHALLEADLRFVSQHSTGLLDVVPTVCACECHAESCKGWLAPGQPAPPLGQCRHCKTDHLGHHEGVTRGIRIGREHTPQSPWEIPKIDRLAIGDKEDLAGNVKRICAGAIERYLGQLVITRAYNGLFGFVVSLKGSDNGIAIFGTLNIRPQWPCERCGNTMLARGLVNGWQGGIKGPCDHFRRAGRLRDELVGCEDVCIRNVADIGPVKEVGVVTDLEVRAALF
jgi:hypothetical protein